MMNTIYSTMVFSNHQPDQPTAMRLNKLRDDLSAAISSIGGYYTDTWRWTTSTTDAAVSGQVGIDSATWAGATHLNLSETNASGIDKTLTMDKVNSSGNSILVKDAANANNYCEYTITGAGVDMGTWRQYPVSTTTGKFSGVLPKNNANTTLTAYVQGATGGAGTGTGDMTKAIYDADNNGKVDTCDSVPWGSVTGKPATIGDMTKAVYDTNGDGISDHAALADAAPWAGITGKPTTFPPDSTAMLKSVYDTNGDGISDHAALADAAPWAGITGKPATFPPDATAELVARKGQINGYAGLDATGKVPSAQLPAFGTGDMLKSVYDTNNDGISDHAALADTAPWTGITGKPASFTPSAHGTTHLDNGTDVIPVVTTARTGLAPKLSGIAGTYLDGTGAYSSPSGSGDMTKSIYDTNNNGVVDTADSIPWASVTGKPAGNLVDPGTWTNVTLGTGWTAPTQAQYRIEVNGAVSTIRFRGMIQAAYSAMGTTAFTVPAGAQPSMTRSCVLGGAQNTGSPSDVASYIASVSSAGVCTIYFLAASAFVWADPSQTQQVYLDGLLYSL